jgi:hypothetical protein
MAKGEAGRSGTAPRWIASNRRAGAGARWSWTASASTPGSDLLAEVPGERVGVSERLDRALNVHAELTQSEVQFFRDEVLIHPIGECPRHGGMMA